jgi:uncharacterized protein YegP (UPF0339 family)
MSAPDPINYQALLDEGIELIEAFSSGHWTDYNVHDPGITTLEFLCYALTDLANRVGLPMESHLAEKVGDRFRLRNDFPEAHDILPCGAVTVRDYRKLLIDLPGVRNAWLHVVGGPHPPIFAIVDQERLSFEGKPDERLNIRGFYDVKVEFDKMVGDGQKVVLKDRIRNVLMANRNLCEDVNTIEEIQLEEISVCIDVELTLDSKVDQVKAEMLYAIDQFIAPSLRRYTLQEMFDKGYRIEEIINGPLPLHGYIEDKDLDQSDTRSELHGSDLIRILMDIPQIVAVRRLLFTTYHDDEVQIQDESAIVPLTAERAARFSREKSKFRFFKSDIPYVTNPSGVEQYLSQIRTRHKQAPIGPDDLFIDLPAPKYVDITHYTSIQHHYPKNYMVGYEGISPAAPVGRRAAVLQFKSFLLLFEQLLAAFNAQIQHVVSLLSPLPVQQTYRHALPEDVPRLDELLQNRDGIASYYETRDTFHQRRNRFLDHLLARFGEQYREYSVLVESVHEDEGLSLLIADKQRLLNNVAALSSSRFQAYDHTLQAPNRTISGLERRLRVLLGYASDIDLSTRQEQHFEIYQEQDPGDIAEYRFRLLDDSGATLLSSTRGMPNLQDSRQVMRTVVMAGIHTENYSIRETNDGKWHFTLYSEDGELVAHRIKYFESFELCQQAMEACAAFLGSIHDEDEIFVLEHMLLRPVSFDDVIDPEAYTSENDTKYLLPTCFEEDDSDCCSGDAYSFRITVVIPAWPERFQDMNFRNFMARFIREQTPAHIFVKVCWISIDQWQLFREVYKDWKSVLAGRNQLTAPNDYLDALEEMIRVWKNLRSVYPPMHLFDCTKANEKTPKVLGDATLGQPNGADDDQD